MRQSLTSIIVFAFICFLLVSCTTTRSRIQKIDHQFTKIERDHEVEFPQAELPKISDSALVSTGPPYITVPVFFGTDRNIVAKGDSTNYFGQDRGSDKYLTGIVTVSIPAKHEPGQIEVPGYLDFLKSNNRQSFFQMIKLELLTDSSFYSKLNELVRQSTEQDILVFVHGYNNSFKDGVFRAAQLSHDLNFKGITCLFSWASKANIFSYTADETNIEWSIPHFEEFLEDIASKSGAKNINVIAHSMGNRALARTLQSFQDKHTNIHFNQIILAAPDIDAAIFNRDISPLFKGFATRTTLYCSSLDKAILISKAVHGYKRAGEGGKNISVSPGVETIDATSLGNIDILNHSYFSQNSKILNDIRLLIYQNLPPLSRSLKEVFNYQQYYWMFK